ISGLILLYAAYIIIQALINDRIASGSLSISILLGIVIFSYDIFTYEGLFAYNDLLFSAGYVILFLLMGYGLLMHLEIIKSGARPITKLSYTDLYNKDHSSK
ncbi:MAG: hypothetical protein K2U26_10570, partial [Cyclobacteriaceae bacterium]|nr:hypothetical protein [Cyclobacteriaceae bacterium]